MEDEVLDHEAVENLLQSQAEEIAESSNSMGERNVDGDYSEDVPDSAEDDNVGTRSEDELFTAVQKGKQKMVRMP